MAKNIVRIVLTGGPAAGKTSLVSRVLKEFKPEDDWRVITIPESATELISGFGIKPFGNCMSMLAFQDYVIADQLHKERLALQAAEIVPEQNVLILYDRAVLDDKAYISDEEFKEVLTHFEGVTEESLIAGYDAVIHLVTCAKGAEFAYNLDNAARTETIEEARISDDRTLRGWSIHPNLRIIDNSVNFEDKINRAITEIFRIVGRPEPMIAKHKFLINMPDPAMLISRYHAISIEMMQTYLKITIPGVERRLRRQRNGMDYLYFYTEKHEREDGSKWVTEKPISEKEYSALFKEKDPDMSVVYKNKFRFFSNGVRYEVDFYPFSQNHTILFCYADELPEEMPAELTILQEVTGDVRYKNRTLAIKRSL